MSTLGQQRFRLLAGAPYRQSLKERQLERERYEPAFLVVGQEILIDLELAIERVRVRFGKRGAGIIAVSAVHLDARNRPVILPGRPESEVRRVVPVRVAHGAGLFLDRRARRGDR